MQANMNYRFQLRALALAAIGSATLLQSALAQSVFYVSPVGRDTWSGTLRQPNSQRTNGPFKTFEGARYAIRVLRSQGKLSNKGVVVNVAPGIYYRQSIFVLGDIDGGTAEAPVVWKSLIPGRAILDGGKALPYWTNLPKAVAAKLNPAIAKKVKQVALKTWKVLHAGNLVRRGFPYVNNENPVELYFDNVRMRPARYPNAGWLNVADNQDASKDKIFTNDGRPGLWSSYTDVMAEGYFGFDWTYSLEKVVGFDKENKVVQLAEPTWYGVNKGQRFAFVNVFTELDQPGEYYIDRAKMMLYFYPPTTSMGRKGVVSVLNDSLIRLDNTNHVRIEGFGFQHTRMTAAEIYFGSNNSIVGCTIKNVGKNGVWLRNGTNNGVDSCNITGVGQAGVVVMGGDRQSLTPANNYVKNTHIWEYAQTCKTYNPAVDITGVGNKVINNRIENAPHIGIQFRGNDHLIENNFISNVCRESGDSGAIYTVFGFNEFGNVIRKNVIQDIYTGAGGHSDHNNLGIYFDGYASGNLIEDNVLRRCTQGILINGGRDNIVRNNVFDDCDLSMFYSAPGQTVDTDLVNKPWFISNWNSVNVNVAPWTSRWPQLANFFNDDPTIPKRNKCEKNVSVGGQWIQLWSIGTTTDPSDASKIYVHNNYAGSNPMFMDMASNDFRLLSGSPVAATGFQPIDFSQLGLQVNQHRTSVPPMNSAPPIP